MWLKQGLTVLALPKNEPSQEKTNNVGFLPSQTQTGFLTKSDTNQPVQSRKQAKSLKFKKKDCTKYVAKTKMLISCAVTAQLICIFVFAYAWFSYAVAQI